MKKINISKDIFSKKTKDYTFVILFFMIFSAFIIFAITPSLRTAFSLNKEEKDLREVDNQYEKKIMDIALIQTQFEESREKIPLINQAISINPEVNKMVDDVKTIADENSFIINQANIEEVNLTQSKKSIDSIRLVIEGKVTFENLLGFIDNLFEQRRLKAVDHLLINQDKESTNSGILQVILTIDGYYL